MKARYGYPLLLLLPSAMLAALAAIVVVAVGAGVLWIFVYGDDPWPASANTLLMALAAVASVTTLLALLHQWQAGNLGDRSLAPDLRSDIGRAPLDHPRHRRQGEAWEPSRHWSSLLA